MNFPQWQAVARIAWRNVRRYPRRNLLVASLIGLPVALSIAGATVAQTVVPTPKEEAAGVLGSADLLLAAPDENVDRALLEQKLPPGSDVLMIRQEDISVVRGGELLSIKLIEPDKGLDPQLRGLYDIERGQAPSKKGEIAVHPQLLESARATIGERIVLDGRSFVMTGLVRESQNLNGEIAITGPGALSNEVPPSSVLISFPPDLSDAALAAAKESVSNLAEASISRADLESKEKKDALSDTLSIAAAVIGLFAVSLVAAAALIMGAHRQLRGLGILQCAGGEPRHARGVVLLTGTTLGIVGSSTGVVFGLGLARALYPFLDRVAGRVVGPFETSIPVIAGSPVMGIIAASIAAYAPARMAGRLSVTDALAARTPAPKPPGRLARRGLITVAAGAALTAWSMTARQGVIAGLGLLMMLVGVFLNIPALVGSLGRLATVLPTSGRQAARDAARHGNRTAAAISAAIIALALPIAVAAHSLAEERFEAQTPRLGDDQLVVGTLGEAAVSELGSVRTQLEKVFPSLSVGSLSKAAVRRGAEVSSQTGVWAFGIKHDKEPRSVTGADLFVGDASLLGAMRAEGGLDALTNGRVLVLGGFEPVKGAVEVRVPIGDGSLRKRRLPAVAVQSPHLAANESFPIVLISQAKAAELGLEGVPNGYLLAASTSFSPDEVERAKEIVGLHAGVYIKSAADYLPTYDLVRNLATSASVQLALAVLAIVVALVVSESRRSLQILVAVGASPTAHRKIVAATAGFLALIAAVLAVPAGLLPLWVVQLASGAGRPLVVPWATLGVVVLLTPLLIALLAGFLTRSPRLDTLLRLSD